MITKYTIYSKLCNSHMVIPISSAVMIPKAAISLLVSINYLLTNTAFIITYVACQILLGFIDLFIRFVNINIAQFTQTFDKNSFSPFITVNLVTSIFKSVRKKPVKLTRLTELAGIFNEVPNKKPDLLCVLRGF